MELELASPYDDEIWERLMADTSQLAGGMGGGLNNPPALRADELLELERCWLAYGDPETDQAVYVGDMLAAADIAAEDAPAELLAQFRRDYHDWIAGGVVNGVL